MSDAAKVILVSSVYFLEATFYRQFERSYVATVVLSMLTLSDSKSTSGTATRMYSIFLFLHVEIKFNERGSNFLNTQSSVSTLVASVVIRKLKICLQAYIL